ALPARADLSPVHGPPGCALAHLHSDPALHVDDQQPLTSAGLATQGYGEPYGDALHSIPKASSGISVRLEGTVIGHQSNIRSDRRSSSHSQPVRGRFLPFENAAMLDVASGPHL